MNEKKKTYKPTVKAIRYILKNEAIDNETVISELAVFLENQQIGVTSDISQPFYVTDNENFIISDSVIIDMGNIAVFANKTAVELQKMFAEMLATMKIEQIAQSLLEIFDDPIPYRIP